MGVCDRLLLLLVHMWVGASWRRGAGLAHNLVVRAPLEDVLRAQSIVALSHEQKNG